MSDASTRTCPSALTKAPGALSLRRLLPFLLFTMLVGISSIWNIYTKLQIPSPSIDALVLTAMPLGTVAVYAHFRDMPALAEAILFFIIHFLYAFFGMKITYLATSLAFPLSDLYFHRLDLFFGFDWHAWVFFQDSHLTLRSLLMNVYPTTVYQVAVLIITLSFMHKTDRNYEMIFILISLLLCCTLISCLLPTLGPASLVGIGSKQEVIMRSLRAGQLGPFSATGIISFPSYHTVMAMTFLYCSRGIRYLFPIFCVWSCAILVSVPYSGDHYFSDILGGLVVVFSSIAVSRLIYPVGKPRLQGSQCYLSARVVPTKATATV